MCEENYYDDEDEFDESLDEDEIWQREQEDYARCWCGAWQWSEKRGEFIHVADCVCGAT